MGGLLVNYGHHGFGELGGFASAVALAIVALMMVVESVQRLLAPQAIHFDEVAIVGISVMPIEFEIDWLGIKSTWQGFGAQIVVIGLSLGLFYKQRNNHDAAENSDH